MSAIGPGTPNVAMWEPMGPEAGVSNAEN